MGFKIAFVIAVMQSLRQKDLKGAFPFTFVYFLMEFL